MDFLAPMFDAHNPGLAIGRSRVEGNDLRIWLDLEAKVPKDWLTRTFGQVFFIKLVYRGSEVYVLEAVIPDFFKPRETKDFRFFELSLVDDPINPDCRIKKD